MVIADREGHHQPRDERVVDQLRHLAVAADEQNGDLRRIDDRRGVGAADGAQVADAECAALEQVEVELAGRVLADCQAFGTPWPRSGPRCSGR